MPDSLDWSGGSRLYERDQRTQNMVCPHFLQILSTAPAWKRLGRNWFSTFAGVTMVEATKQIYALSGPEPAASRRRLGFARPVSEVKVARRDEGLRVDAAATTL